MFRRNKQHNRSIAQTASSTSFPTSHVLDEFLKQKLHESQAKKENPYDNQVFTLSLQGILSSHPTNVKSFKTKKAFLRKSLANSQPFEQLL